MMFFNESLHIHRTGTYIVYVGNEKCGPLGNIQSFVSQLIICLENRVKKLERLMEVGGFVIVGKNNIHPADCTMGYTLEKEICSMYS